ncbi:MAG: RNA-binding cell elongation regulator Jag/EloR [Acidimicrobiales bacterium]
MEWVETTGSTVAAALAAALETLGVDERDADVVVVEQARSGFLGFGRSDARVRARVRPATPRPKRPQRGRRDRSGPGAARSGGTARRSAASGSDQQRDSGERGGRQGASTPPVAPDGEASSRRGGPRRRPRGSHEGRDRQMDEGTGVRSRVVDEEGRQMSVDQQAETAGTFVRGVVECFGVEAATAVEVEDALVTVAVTGEDLGLLIGPRGATLDALQELTRTVVQRRGEEHGTRIVVDVAGFRARRTAALEAFVRRVAEDVAASGTPEVLEPMSAADRKVVHDTVNSIDGVETSSEGVEPRRFVVIRPSTVARDESADA